jgi:hypothetical protein
LDLETTIFVIVQLLHGAQLGRGLPRHGSRASPWIWLARGFVWVADGFSGKRIRVPQTVPEAAHGVVVAHFSGSAAVGTV